MESKIIKCVLMFSKNITYNSYLMRLSGLYTNAMLGSLKYTVQRNPNEKQRCEFNKLQQHAIGGV